MKGAIKRIMGMSILLVGLMTYAENGDPKPEMEVTSVSAERFLLVVKEVKSKTSMQLKDSEGTVIYSEKMESGKSFRKVYDLSELPSGTYYLKIIDEEYSRVYSVVKNYKKLEVAVDFSSPRINQKMLAILMN